MKRSALIPALAACVFAGSLAACKEEAANKPAETKPAAKTTPAAPANPAPAPKTETPAAKPAAAAVAANQDTPAGAAKLFVTAMSAGDFRRAAELNDPASESYAKLIEFADLIDVGKSKNAPIEMLTGAFSKAWQGAETTLGEEQGRNARCTFKLAGGKTVDVTMQKTEGKWYVFGDESILQTSGDKTAAPAPAPAPAQPKPAGEQPQK